MNKEKYLNKLDQLSLFCQEFNLDDKVNQDIEKLRKELVEFKIKIPFVGRFNAGKSALLNTILGGDVLKEEQKPETCLATEIKFGTHKVIAHYTDGTTSEHHIDILMKLGADGDEQDEINVNKCRYLEVYLPIPGLRELGKDIILVDMPGFDSGIESHNKAILRYLSEGSLFMLVIDCEDGTIKTTDIAFLDELDSFNVEFKVLLNKADKKPESQLNQIKSEVENSLQRLFYRDIEVCLTSIMNEDTPEVIKKAISTIDKDKALEHFFSSRLEKIEQEILLLLETLKNASQLDTREIDQTIDELKNKYHNLERKLAVESRELKYKLTSVAKNDILNDLRNAILQQSSFLARRALSGEESFVMALNEIIRPVLLSATSKHVEIQFNHLVENLETEFLDINEVITGIRGSFTLASSSINGIAKAAKAIDGGKKFAKGYKAVTTGLAVFTSVVAPWLELILIFLPEILKMFGLGSEKSQIDKMREKIETELVGQIIFKLTPEIEKSLIELEEEYVAQLNEQFNEQLESIKNTLEQVKGSKVEKIEQQKDYIEKINVAIETISELVG
ncbi:hypothetical protein HMPREF9402_1034 [Turicibacter sp. HGF1]|uniref:dynamin family protein n=1 Tax=Turicibacter sp. HGF1 TaxID=910310 RepID=UPI0001FD99CE|nr:dynamin family protein [Turicibacter sp. HGF1]EGC93291.1 hypothetical protein HMPREF9402_1034 [Turicibacter sp. HGF1]